MKHNYFRALIEMLDYIGDFLTAHIVFLNIGTERRREQIEIEATQYKKIKYVLVGDRTVRNYFELTPTKRLKDWSDRNVDVSLSNFGQGLTGFHSPNSCNLAKST